MKKLEKNLKLNLENKKPLEYVLDWLEEHLTKLQEDLSFCLLHRLPTYARTDIDEDYQKDNSGNFKKRLPFSAAFLFMVNNKLSHFTSTNFFVSRNKPASIV